MPITDAAIKEEASILFRTLIRYRNEHEFEAEERRLLFGDDDGVDTTRISSAVYIINDYLQYGVLRRKRHILSQSRLGRIDWNKTINKTIPVVSGHRAIYTNPIMSINELDAQRIVMRIHQFIVFDCCSLWGWLLDVSEEELPPCDLPCSLEEALDILRTELSSTFVQREITLLNTMIEYLAALQGAKEHISMEFLCTPYFHWIWEAVCGYVFENEYAALKAYEPSPCWHSTLFDASIDQRPDILFIRDRTLYILDAKYYNYKKNMPGWHDVVKQFFIVTRLNKQQKPNITVVCQELRLLRMRLSSLAIKGSEI